MRPQLPHLQVSTPRGLGRPKQHDKHPSRAQLRAPARRLLLLLLPRGLARPVGATRTDDRTRVWARGGAARRPVHLRPHVRAVRQVGGPKWWAMREKRNGSNFLRGCIEQRQCVLSVGLGGVRDKRF